MSCKQLTQQELNSIPTGAKNFDTIEDCENDCNLTITISNTSGWQDGADGCYLPDGIYNNHKYWRRTDGARFIFWDPSFNMFSLSRTLGGSSDFGVTPGDEKPSRGVWMGPICCPPVGEYQGCGLLS